MWEVTIRDGVRVSSSTAYLRPAWQPPQSELRLRAHATRVLFEGRRATGVEFIESGARRVLKARREVILSGGAVNSPQLLSSPGVGDAEFLRRLGIAVIVDSPAVGRDLQDHLAVNYYYRSRVPTLNNELAPVLGKLRAALRYALARRTGPLAMSVNQAGGFCAAAPALTRPNMHIYFNPASYSTATRGSKRRLMNPDPYPGFLMSFNSCRPVSRGTIHIRSLDPRESPAIRPNALSAPEDVRDVCEGSRLLRRIAAAGPLAGIIEAEREPGNAVTSDQQILADFRSRSGSVFHACGTCAMGSDARASVLDPRLRVRGVTALRVVDASAFPNLTSGNTNAPVLMLAEKAADLILEDNRAPQG